MRRQTDSPNVSRQQDHVLNSRTVEERSQIAQPTKLRSELERRNSVTTKNTESLPSSDDFGLGVDFCKRPLFFGGTLKHPQSLGDALPSQEARSVLTRVLSAPEEPRR